MNRAQWLFEFYSLQKKEAEQTDLVIEVLKTFKNMLVNILGLNLLKDVDAPADDESFMPLAMIAGRREIAEMIINKLNKEHVEKQAIEDQSFDELSEAFARGEIEDPGDMDPIIEEKLTQANRQASNDYLSSLGVKLVDEISTASHIDLDMGKIHNDMKEVVSINKSIESNLKTLKKPIKIQFDGVDDNK